jgi:DNA-binding transcriptional ArsR family regulator
MLEQTRLPFAPSTFTWPHIWASTDPGWPIGITYQASSTVRHARQPAPPPDLLQLLRACGDDVRLQTLRWLAQGPRTTQELAPLIGITEPAMSKHLRHLSNAGLVASRRDGRYVLYDLRPEGLKPLTSGLMDYVLHRPEPRAGDELASETPNGCQQHAQTRSTGASFRG